MQDLGLYLHIPFCVRKCAYCDFLSAPGKEEEILAYSASLVREIRSYAQVGLSREVKSIFFGGGTPSLLPVRALKEIFAALEESFCIAEDAEVTMEMNPGTIREEFLACAVSHINRVSLGVQSAVPRELAALGRIHTFGEAVDAVRMLKEAGIWNLNLDLMSGIPYQSERSFRETLEKAIALAPSHISCYSLILEEGTPFIRAYREGSLPLPDEDEERRMAETAAEVLSLAGYRQYEFSNYAKPGCECRHNIRYWKRGEYLGFGTGAASFYQNTRWTNTRDMAKYLDGAADPERIREDVQKIGRREAMEEFMFLGLRMTEGVLDRDFQSSFGVSLSDVYGPVLSRHEREGFLLSDGDGRFCLTRRGAEVSNVILADYLDPPSPEADGQIAVTGI